MRALWSGCQDSVVFGIVVCDQSDLLVREKGGPSLLPDLQLLSKQTLWARCSNLAPCLMFSIFLLFTVPFSTLTQMYQCPYCKFTNTDLNRLRMHVMTQHSVQPMLQCPLCQDMLNNKIHLQFHLTHLHSVAPDCVDKLIATVSPVLCDSYSSDAFLSLEKGSKEAWIWPGLARNVLAFDHKDAFLILVIQRDKCRRAEEQEDAFTNEWLSFGSPT